MAQFPQLVRGNVVLCPQLVGVPTISKSAMVILQSWNENKVAAEEVCWISNAPLVQGRTS